MRAGQKLYDNIGKQVALFPLPAVYVSQADYETYSHESWYYATDYLGYNASGTRVLRCPCYAPVDIRCIYIDTNECLAVWESINKVHLANDTIDYLGLIVYHDNDIANGLVSVGTTKAQGETFNKTGTGGSATGDHMHLETGYGKYSQPNTSTPRGTANYKYHFTDYTDVKRLHNYNALFINDTTIINSPSAYTWVDFGGGHTSPKRKHYKFVLFNRKHRIKQKSIFN